MDEREPNRCPECFGLCVMWGRTETHDAYRYVCAVGHRWTEDRARLIEFGW